VTDKNACPILKGEQMGDYYQTEKEIRDVVAGFESCTTGKDDFSHRSHLTVAVWYLRISTPEQAFKKMCSGLLRFLDHHALGRSIYNEPVTLAWINLIQTVIETYPDFSLLEMTNIVVERLSNTRVVVNDQDEKRLVVRQN
jgi:hypothetical protein